MSIHFFQSRQNCWKISIESLQGKNQIYWFSKCKIPNEEGV